MAAHTAEEMQKHVRIYLVVFATLAGLTLITVAISYLDLTMTLAVIIAIFVATVKASLVATYFMHLISERGLIFWILGFTILFFAVCLMIPALSDYDMKLLIR